MEKTHLETGRYKNSQCLEAAQYNSPVSMDLLRLKRSGGNKKIIKRIFHNFSTKNASSGTDYFFTDHFPAEKIRESICASHTYIYVSITAVLHAPMHFPRQYFVFTSRMCALVFQVWSVLAPMPGHIWKVGNVV